jgi:hypothetical protein
MGLMGQLQQRCKGAWGRGGKRRGGEGDKLHVDEGRVGNRRWAVSR